MIPARPDQHGIGYIESDGQRLDSAPRGSAAVAFDFRKVALVDVGGPGQFDLAKIELLAAATEALAQAFGSMVGDEISVSGHIASIISQFIAPGKGNGAEFEAALANIELNRLNSVLTVRVGGGMQWR